MPKRESRRNLLCAGCCIFVVIIVLLAVIIYLATREPQCKDKESSSVTIETSKYGSIDGKQIYRYTFKNKNNVEISIINYGGIITNIYVPDKDGKLADIVLGYDSIEGYKTNGAYFGAIIGRYSNRIAKGSFSIDGENYTLAINNPPNALHGGVKGFDKRVWSASVQEGKLMLNYTSEDKEEGYPGEVNAMVTYMLTEKNELVIEYSATTSKKTVINLTNHAYFNLAGQGSGNIFQHEAKINAEYYTPVDSTLIPTGQLASVSGTMYDLRTAVNLGDRIPKVPGGIGFDINYSFGKTGWIKSAARVVHPATGRILDMFTTEPGIQFYTAHYLNETGKGNAKYGQYDAFCLEAQHYPDSPNQASFPTTVLAPTETYRQSTTYKFGVL